MSFFSFLRYFNEIRKSSRSKLTWTDNGITNVQNYCFFVAIISVIIDESEICKYTAIIRRTIF